MTVASSASVRSWASGQSDTRASAHPAQQYDLVLALHDFVPSDEQATCLAFKAGDIIHVLNRDPSGWWDGEINGGRGWFPSNYTGACEPDEPLQPRSKTPGHKSVNSLSSQRGTSSPNSPSSSTRTGQFSVYSALDQILKHADEGPAIFQPLLQGISLLKNAVVSHRTSHFQPSTTCILTCIRNILVRADCLDRETHTMLVNPPLAAERKRVLDDLSALVAQTRDCLERGSPSDDEESLEMDDQTKAREHAKLLTHAFHVYLDIESFVEVAIKSGIDFPRRRACSDAAYQSDDNQDRSQRSESFAKPPRRRTISATQPNTRFTEPGQRHRRAASSSQSQIPASNPTCSSTTIATAEGIRSAQTYPLPPSPASSASSASSPHLPDGPCTPDEALSFLHALYDDVLDCVSKFVAKVHSYDPGDSAWKGEMVACTSAVVMKIAKMVAAVDAVANAGASTSRLREIKERMYIVANTLVDSVKQLVASIDIRTVADTDEEPAEVQKRQALQWVTGTLQAASECDTALRDAIQHHLGAGARIQFANPGSTFRSDVPRDTLREPTTSPLVAPFEPASPGLPDVPEESHEDEDQDAAPPANPDAGDASNSQPERARLASVSSIADSDLSCLSRRDSSAVDSTFSARADADSLLSDIAEVQPDEETESQQDLKTRLPRLAIPDRSTPGEGDSDDPDTMSPLEIKILHGDLPPVPRTPLPSFAPVDQLMTSSEDDEDPATAAAPRAASPAQRAASIRAASVRAASIRAASIRTFVSIPGPPPDVIYNAEGMLLAATLDALVERMTPHAHIVDAQFSHVFFSTFRMFTTPVELVDALRTRYNLVAPPELDNDEKVAWKAQTQTPVRLRVINFIRTWLESQWRAEPDVVALDHLSTLVDETITPTLGRPATKLIELINSRRSVGSPTSETGVDATAGASVLLMGNSPGPSTVSSPIGDVPRPIVNRSLVAALRESQYPHVSPLDFDPRELARQLTIMESDLFCAIRPEDILNSDKPSDGVRQLSTLSNALTTWVVESVLGESDSKRRAAVLKFFIKVADRCLAINNFAAPRAILAALESSTLSRLHQTWQGLDKKSLASLDELRTIANPARNYLLYRTRLKTVSSPAVPFFGLYLTDMTFCREGNPSHRSPVGHPDTKLINFVKYYKMVRIAQDIQRFQLTCYALKPIPEIQTYLGVVLHDAPKRGDMSDMYRRSLLIEPSQPVESSGTTEFKHLRVFGWAGTLRGNPTTPS